MAQPNATISVRKAFEHVAIIDLGGELTSSAEGALLNAYQQTSNDGARVLILNFSHLEYKEQQRYQAAGDTRHARQRCGAAPVCCGDE